MTGEVVTPCACISLKRRVFIESLIHRSAGMTKDGFFRFLLDSGVTLAEAYVLTPHHSKYCGNT